MTIAVDGIFIQPAGPEILARVRATHKDSSPREAFEDFGHKNKKRIDQRREVLANHQRD